MESKMKGAFDMMKKRFAGILFLVIVIMAFMLSGCDDMQGKEYKANDGILDLRGYDISSGGTIPLNGEWAFYWGKLLDAKALNAAKPDLYIRMPGMWSHYKLDGMRLSGSGYATYRLHVRSDFPAGTLVGLRIRSIPSAYSVYVNDHLIGACGTVGMSEVQENGRLEPKNLNFNAPGPEFDLILQVSNFQYQSGGVWYGIELGSSERIDQLHDLSFAQQFFISGAAAILAVLNLIIFILRRELRYTLFLAVFFVLAAMCSDMFGQMIILQGFPFLRAQDTIFLWYSAMNWTIFLYLLAMNEFFPSKFALTAVRIYFAAAAILQTLYLITDPSIYTRGTLLQILVNTGGFISVLVIAVLGIRDGKKDGWLHITAILTVMTAFILDQLHWAQLINDDWGQHTFPAMLLFLTIEILAEAMRIRRFTEEKIAAELMVLQYQIKPHFLFNALNTVISISRYDPEQATKLLLDLSNYLRRSVDFQNLNQFVPMRNEIELAQAYIGIQQARFQERLNVHFDLCEEPEVFVPVLMLQPILENAVNHGVLPKADGGTIHVSVRREGKYLHFFVKDDGVGISRQEQKKIMKPPGSGSGGMCNVNLRLRKLYGAGLEIRSEEGIGTEIRWKIPIEKPAGKSRRKGVSAT